MMTKCKCKEKCKDDLFLTLETKNTAPHIKATKKHDPLPDTTIDEGLDLLHHKLKHNNLHEMQQHKLQIIKIQNDIGADISVTNTKDELLPYQQISPLQINDVQKGDPAITCTGKGYLPWKSRASHTLLVPNYYCEQANGAIISPNSVQQLYHKMLKEFHMFCDSDEKTGHLKCYH